MRKIACIAVNTYRELVRGKALYSIFFFAIVLLIISAFFGNISIGDQVKVIKDFGLFSSSFFTVAFAVISGSALLHKELSKKTIFNILAKPVERYHFVIGKYLGMLSTAIIMLLLMALAMGVFISFFPNGGALALIPGYYSIALQIIVVCAATIFFSSIVVTPMLSGAFTFCFFIAARSTEYLQTFASDPKSNVALKYIANFFYNILPHLDLVDVGNRVVYSEEIPGGFLAWATLYCLTYAGILLVLAVLIFQKKEFK